MCMCVCVCDVNKISLYSCVCWYITKCLLFIGYVFTFTPIHNIKKVYDQNQNPQKRNRKRKMEKQTNHTNSKANKKTKKQKQKQSTYSSQDWSPRQHPL